MTGAVSAAARADLHALVREWCRTQGTATDRRDAEEFALAVGRIAAECAFESAVATCGTRVGYRGTSQPCRCGARARELVFLGDGAEWIGKLANHHFSDAVQILEGVAQGIAQGETNAARRLALWLLRERFGDLPSAVVPRIEGERLEWCEDLAVRMLHANSLAVLGL